MGFSQQAIRSKEFKSTISHCELQFKTLQKKDKRAFQFLEKYFLEYIQPVYGNQSQILQKIKNGKDRTCEFLIFCGRPVGVLIYKNQLSEEFSKLGIEGGFELKTVFLLERKTKTSGLFLKSLLGRAAQLALQREGKCIFGTVSSKKLEVLKVMCKLGFSIVETFEGKYIENVDEYLICHKNPSYLINGTIYG
jgi:hypothetical protein